MANTAETAEEYGYVQSLFNAVPELKSLFNKAVKGQWTAGKFQAELRNTKWWKTHGQSERDYLILQYGDPATAKQKMSAAVTQVRQISEQMGFQWSKDLESKIQLAAFDVVARDWSQQDIQYYLGQFLTFKGTNQPGGTTGQAMDQIQQYSYNMGVKNSDAWYQGWARNIARGLNSVEDVEQAIRKSAETMFPQWKAQLEAGQTVADLASPYMQSMAQVLEIAPGSINLFDPTIKKALQFKDPKTGTTGVQPIWDFENTLRNDPRWKKTKNAQDSIMQTAHQVLADFGVVY